MRLNINIREGDDKISDNYDKLTSSTLIFDD